MSAGNLGPMEFRASADAKQAALDSLFERNLLLSGGDAYKREFASLLKNYTQVVTGGAIPKLEYYELQCAKASCLFVMAGIEKQLLDSGIKTKPYPVAGFVYNVLVSGYLKNTKVNSRKPGYSINTNMRTMDHRTFESFAAKEWGAKAQKLPAQFQELKDKKFVSISCNVSSPTFRHDIPSVKGHAGHCAEMCSGGKRQIHKKKSFV
eukprot:Nk52_evm65s1073 gene=Nk52_evmTU65s1073